MNLFKLLSFNGGWCGGSVEFEHNGKMYKTTTKAVHSGHYNIIDRKWGHENVVWAQIPPNLTDYEKDLFIEMLNTCGEQPTEHCKKCCSCLDLFDTTTFEQVLQFLFNTTDPEQAVERGCPMKFSINC